MNDPLSLLSSAVVSDGAETLPETLAVQAEAGVAPRVRRHKVADISKSVIRSDKTHTLAPGLFVLKPATPYENPALAGGENSDRRSRVTTETRSAEIVKITQTRGDFVVTFETEPMSPRELRVLHALIAIAMGADPSRRAILSGARISLDPAATDAWERIGIGQVMSPSWKVVEIRTSMREIARFCGMQAQNSERLRFLLQGLVELAKVNIMYFKRPANSKEREIPASRPMRLLGFENVGNLVAVTLNPFLAAAILDDGNQFALINMQDFYRVKGEAALLILRRLSGYIDFGKSRVVSYPTLVGYVYGGGAETSESTPSVRKNQSAVIRKAIKHIAAVGWKCEEVVPGRWAFTRPAAPVERQLSLRGMTAPGALLSE